MLSVRSCSLIQCRILLLALEDLNAAIAAFEEAAQVLTELKEDHLLIEPLAGLVRCYAHLDQRDDVLRSVHDLDALLSAEQAIATVAMAEGYFACFEALVRIKAENAPFYLRRAQETVTAIAEMIEEPAIRATFLKSEPLITAIMRTRVTT